MAIAKRVDPNPRVMLIASGDNFPSGAAMPSATQSYLNTLAPAAPVGGGITRIVTVGGPGDKAVIDAYMAGKLHWGEEFSRIKPVGTTRQDTATAGRRRCRGLSRSRSPRSSESPARSWSTRRTTTRFHSGHAPQGPLPRPRFMTRFHV